jgi:hypothetical protein
MLFVCKYLSRMREGINLNFEVNVRHYCPVQMNKPAVTVQQLKRWNFAVVQRRSRSFAGEQGTFVVRLGSIKIFKGEKGERASGSSLWTDSNNVYVLHKMICQKHH